MNGTWSAAKDVAWSLRMDARRLRELAHNLRTTTLGPIIGRDLEAAASRLEQAARRATRETERS